MYKVGKLNYKFGMGWVWGLKGLGFGIWFLVFDFGIWFLGIF